MNQREKILAFLAFGATGFLLVAFIISKLIVGPTTEARKLAEKIVLDIDMLEAKVAQEPVYKENLLTTVKQSYGDDPSTASEMSRAHIVKLISKAGLLSDDLSMTPVTGKTVRGGREVGWIIRVKGSLDRLTNFLYVVNADPHLHKLDNVAWAPVTGSTDLTLSARFVTLVLDPIEGIGPVEIKPDALVNNVKLDSTERKSYALISDRDIFRPYIKRPPPPPPPTIVRETRPSGPAPPPPPPPPVVSSFQLVGLPTWNDEAEVVVKDSRSLLSKTYKVGQDLLGGEIVMVDYRSLPLPKKPQIMSSSRVIVRVGRDYWAVELGQFLTDKYLLTGDRLPESLRSLQPALAPESPAKMPVESGAQKPLSSDSTPLATIPDSGSVPVLQEAGHAP